MKFIGLYIKEEHIKKRVSVKEGEREGELAWAQARRHAGGITIQ